MLQKQTVVELGAHPQVQKYEFNQEKNIYAQQIPWMHTLGRYVNVDTHHHNCSVFYPLGF